MIHGHIHQNHPATRFEVGTLVGIEYANRYTVHRITDKKADALSSCGVVFKLDPLPYAAQRLRDGWIDGLWLDKTGLEF